MKSAITTIATLFVGCGLFFQNCAPRPLETTDAASYNYGTSGDSIYRLPANFSETLNTGVTCQVSLNATNIPIGINYTFTFTTTGTVPAGYRIYTYGSKNGVADASEVVPQFFSAMTLQDTNPGTIGGTYIRYFQIRDPLGRALCQTNAVQVTLQGRNCTLSASASTVRTGQAIVLTTTYGADTAVPAGGALQFHGSNNGIDIQPIPYDQTDFTRYTRVMTDVDVGSEYVRRIAVLNQDGSTYCETNSVRVRVTNANGQ